MAGESGRAADGSLKEKGFAGGAEDERSVRSMVA